MNQDNTGISNPIAQENASTTNENNVETANKITMESVPPTTPTPSTDPKKPKGLITTTIILAILALAGIAFGIYGMFFKTQPNSQPEPNQTSNNTKEPTTQDNDEESDHASDQEVRDLISQLLEKLNDGPYAKTYDETLFVKTEGAKTLIPAERTYGLYSTLGYDAQGFDSEKNLELHRGALTELGFIKNTEIESSPLVNGIDDFINVDKNIACASSPMKIVCANISWVPESAISTANDLADAYYVKKSTYPLLVDTSLITIKESEVAPYQTLSVPTDNAMSLFYRNDTSSDWQYFMTTQTQLKCGDYNTTDLKNAFSGDICYDEASGSNSTVQP